MILGYEQIGIFCGQWQREDVKNTAIEIRYRKFKNELGEIATEIRNLLLSLISASKKPIRIYTVGCY